MTKTSLYTVVIITFFFPTQGYQRSNHFIATQGEYSAQELLFSDSRKWVFGIIKSWATRCLLLHHTKHPGFNCKQSISHDYEKNSPKNLSETVRASAVAVCEAPLSRLSSPPSACAAQKTFWCQADTAHRSNSPEPHRDRKDSKTRPLFSASSDRVYSGSVGFLVFSPAL